MPDLASLTRNHGLEFYLGDKKLDADIADLGEDDWNLVEHIAGQTDREHKHLTIKGKSLEEFLYDIKNVYQLTDFMIQLFSEKVRIDGEIYSRISKLTSSYVTILPKKLKNRLEKNLKNFTLQPLIFNATQDFVNSVEENSDIYPAEMQHLYNDEVKHSLCALSDFFISLSLNSNFFTNLISKKADKTKSKIYELTDSLADLLVKKLKKGSDIKIHVEADIEEINKHYCMVPEEEWIINGLGQKVVNTAEWLPRMLYFEKGWNFALCDAMGGWVGYPGYEWPTTEECFEAVVAGHAKNFVIGTKEQLLRYEYYARKFPEYRSEIVDVFYGFT